MVYKVFDKKSASLDKSTGSGAGPEPIYQLTNELHKHIIELFLFKTKEELLLLMHFKK